ncbi:PREDICTED: receptor activity-modifying protein 2 [Lepidothrix coronata]|uniref:Receptor activity-modifying protein 2 n=1 Tax=Lepidothrix coronata TaxID=321398 RepID=A0A6J0ISM5_9PASS|nr:PREDICTED: receptor activity-modifying protein 2 [Lepidothrix coronata]XP_017689567.1 PREDICTED: receptor activity-modifying protein 2 [Lepidothrix coronata]
MAPLAHTSSDHLSQGLLLLWVLLGTGLCHTDAETKGFGQDAGTSSPMAMGTAQPMEGNYSDITQKCWDYFVYLMRNVTASELCEWKVIRRPYSDLQLCLELWADRLNYSYPNALAEQYIFQSHHRYFHNCTLEHPVYFDPPEDVLLAMIIAPICLIPFLVTLVIWRSKDGKAQA